MKSLVLLSMTLSIACSASPVFAMSRPVFVDETCETMTEAPATPALKAWFKRLCPKAENSPEPACKDFPAFIRAVTANNENWRRKCVGSNQ